jgi:hypothetical protein
VNGAAWPVDVLAPVPLAERTFGVLAPLAISVRARLDAAPRTEVPWPRRLDVGAARPDTPADTEAIVVQL